MGKFMKVAEVLARLSDLGLKVKADGGQVLVAPAEKVTPEVVELVTTHKQALLAALRPKPQRGVAYPCGRCGHRIYTRIESGWQCDSCLAVYEIIGGTLGPVPYEKQNLNR